MGQSAAPMALGEHMFRALGFAFQGQQIDVQTPWAELAVADGLDSLQWMGPKSETVTIKGVLFPEEWGGLDTLDAVKKDAKSGKELELVTGAGLVKGLHVIFAVREDRSFVAADGSPRRDAYEIVLRRIEKRSGAAGGSLFGAAPAAAALSGAVLANATAALGAVGFSGASLTSALGAISGAGLNSAGITSVITALTGAQLSGAALPGAVQSLVKAGLTGDSLTHAVSAFANGGLTGDSLTKAITTFSSAKLFAAPFDRAVTAFSAAGLGDTIDSTLKQLTQSGLIRR